MQAGSACHSSAISINHPYRNTPGDISSGDGKLSSDDRDLYENRSEDNHQTYTRGGERGRLLFRRLRGSAISFTKDISPSPIENPSDIGSGDGEPSSDDRDLYENSSEDINQDFLSGDESEISVSRRSRDPVILSIEGDISPPHREDAVPVSTQNRVRAPSTRPQSRSRDPAQGVDSSGIDSEPDDTIHSRQEEMAAKLDVIFSNRCSCNKGMEQLQDEHNRCKAGDRLTNLTDHSLLWNEIAASHGLYDPSMDDGLHPICDDKILARDSAHDLLPWQKLLGPNKGDAGISRRLSLRYSELKLLVDKPRTVREQYIITRTWDVDSFIARTTTLAAHKGGFSLAYKPPFLRRITQNPRILILGHQIQKLKQLRFGYGLYAGGFGYNTHIFFPKMTVGKSSETHLTDRQQQIWLDRVIIPSLSAVCPSHVVQHHPRSYDEASTKSHVKTEGHPQGAVQPIDIRYTVPQQYLARFWSTILQTITGLSLIDPEIAPFCDPFLVISGHNLKLQTKSDSLEEVFQTYHEHLRTCFDFSTESFPLDECWLEDTPSGPANMGLTILRKATCLEDWASAFACPGSNRQLTQQQFFHWSMTKDAGSCSVALRQTNEWRSKSGMAYNKAYNLNKDVFATPFKDYKPFDNDQFEALA